MQSLYLNPRIQALLKLLHKTPITIYMAGMFWVKRVPHNCCEGDYRRAQIPTAIPAVLLRQIRAFLERIAKV
jgi:hypothetical protein